MGVAKTVSEPRRAYFPSLDSVRTVACCFPLFNHLFWPVLHPRISRLAWLQGSPMDLLAFVFGNGTFGVRLFFVLSGFLITYLMLREREAVGRFSFGQFFIRRMLRIWPPYYAVVLYSFTMLPLAQRLVGTPQVFSERVWMSVLFLSNFDLIRLSNTPGVLPNEHLSLTWSVSVEEQFYVLWPLLLLAGGPRGLLVGGVVCWFAALGGQITLTQNWALWSCHTLPCFLFLASGGLLAWVYFHWPRALEQRLGHLRYRWVVASYGLGFYLLLQVGLQALQSAAWMPIFGVATAGFCCWVLATQIAHERHPWSGARIRWLARLGKYTYGLYLYHRIAQWWVWQAARQLGLPGLFAVKLLLVALSFVGAFALAYLSLHFYERFFLKQRARFTPAPQPHFPRV